MRCSIHGYGHLVVGCCFWLCIFPFVAAAAGGGRVAPLDGAKAVRPAEGKTASAPAPPAPMHPAKQPLDGPLDTARIQTRMKRTFSRVREINQAIQTREAEIRKDPAVRKKLDEVFAEAEALQQQARELRRQASELSARARALREQGEMRIWEEADPELAGQKRVLRKLYEERRALARELSAKRRNAASRAPRRLPPRRRPAKPFAPPVGDGAKTPAPALLGKRAAAGQTRPPPPPPKAPVSSAKPPN